MVEVKKGERRQRRKGFTRLSAKNQATIPVEVLQAAGVRAGDELQVKVLGPGRIALERELDSIDEFAGALSGVFPPGFLKELRGEWESPSSTQAS